MDNLTAGTFGEVGGGIGGIRLLATATDGYIVAIATIENGRVFLVTIQSAAFEKVLKLLNRLGDEEVVSEVANTKAHTLFQ